MNMNIALLRKNSTNFNEYNFLDLFYQKMLNEGLTYNLVQLSVNSIIVKDINDKLSVSITNNDLKKMTDICLANGWLKNTSMCVDKYCNLQLTEIGFGVVKSKQKQAELLSNRNILKKIADYIEEIKGLFIPIGVVIALATLFIKIL